MSDRISKLIEMPTWHGFSTETDPLSCIFNRAQTGRSGSDLHKLKGPDASLAPGGRLAALQGSGLADRFYSWQSVSGARHICTIFPVLDEKTVAEFSDVVIIGVIRKFSLARPICVIASEAFSAPDGRELRDRAHALGCTEWHVYFNDSADRTRDLVESFNTRNN
jgi:hypothetical protein